MKRLAYNISMLKFILKAKRKGLCGFKNRFTKKKKRIAYLAPMSAK
jgi:hypothetical protein